MRIFFTIIATLFLVTLSAQTLRIAVYQYGNNPRTNNLQPFANHLQQQLGIPASVKSYPTVQHLIKAMQSGEVDVAFISTFGYLLLQAGKASHPMLPVATLTVPTAKDNYKTAFVARKETSLRTLASIGKAGAGKRLALVATGSTSGNLVPRLILKGAGIKEAEQHFASVRYAGTHAKAIELLLNDSADVAAMGSTEWDKLDSVKRASLQLLFLSAEIPLGPVLLNKEINDRKREQIEKLLLNLHQSDSTALSAIKAAWSEAKQATHFIAIGENYYIPYLKQFGDKNALEVILKKFAN